MGRLHAQSERRKAVESGHSRRRAHPHTCLISFVFRPSRRREEGPKAVKTTETFVLLLLCLCSIEAPFSVSRSTVLGRAFREARIQRFSEVCSLEA